MAIEMTTAGGGWFHVYNRGVAKQAIFRRAADRRVFLDCFARHLGPDVQFDSRGRAYRNLREVVCVGAYCLMPNHFHLVVGTDGGDQSITALMRSATIAYGKYFNQRYGRDGPLWRGRHQTKELSSTESVLRATAYVHLNHRDDPEYQWSSHRFMVGQQPPTWLASDKLLEAVGGLSAYERYVAAELVTRARRRSENESNPDSWQDLSN